MRKYSGQWYLPNKPGEKIPGLLKIRSQKRKLSLELYSNDWTNERINGKILLGHHGLDKITLLECRALRESQISNNFYLSKYQPYYVFIGCHFNSIEEIKFKEVSVHLKNLGTWLYPKKGGFYDFKFENDDSITLKSIPRKRITIPLESDNCELHFNTFCLPGGDYISQFKMKVYHSATFEFKTHTLYQNIIVLISKLKLLLMLFTGKPTSVIMQQGLSEKAVDLDKLYPEKMQNNPIRIYHFDNLDENNTNDSIHFSKLLISPINFSNEELCNIITNWFTSFDKYEPVYDIFFHAIRPFWNGGSFTISNVEYNNAFLNIVQALESYHRIKTNGLNKDTSDFNQRKERIKRSAHCLSQEDKEWLEKYTKPKKGKDFTLLERIQSLANNKVIKNLFVGETDIEAQLVKWRDSLTHINHIKSKDVNVIYLFNHAQIIFIVNLFIDLKIPEDKIENIIQTASVFRHR